MNLVRRSKKGSVYLFKYILVCCTTKMLVYFKLFRELFRIVKINSKNVKMEYTCALFIVQKNVLLKLNREVVITRIRLNRKI